MTAEAFRALHHSGPPLVLVNAWDPVSARIIAAGGAPAIATSSGAMARVLGYDDGQLTPATEMLAAVARVARAVDVPVTADMEAGYGLPAKEFAERLLETGAVGCNLEDSLNGVLVDPGEFADYLAEVRATAGADLVINARVDTFLLEGTPADAVARGRSYRRAGADCVYPILAPVSSIDALVHRIKGPVNVIAEPDTPPPAELEELGVARMTWGSNLATVAYAEAVRIAALAL